MDASYHDFLEAAYFGRYSVFDRARNNYDKPGIPYRNDRAGMDSLTAKPSYHFSRDLTLALANHVMEPVGGEIDLFGNLMTPHNSLHADTPEGERLAGLVNGHLDTLGLDNVALVFEGPPGGTTIVIITCFEWFTTNYLVAVWQDKHGWMMLDGGHITRSSNVFMGMAEKALSLLANPAVAWANVKGRRAPLVGTVVQAEVVLSDPAVTEADLAAWCAERLADYAVPRRFRFLDSIPLKESLKSDV